MDMYYDSTFRRMNISSLEKALALGRRKIASKAMSSMPPGMLILVIALTIGVFTGCMAAAMKAMLSFFYDLILYRADRWGMNWRFLVFPLVGVIITALFQHYVVGGSVARGSRIIRQDLRYGRLRLSPFTVFNPVIGCATTVGFGASGGSEGPTALSGAAIGSRVGQWLGLDDDWLRILVGVGAAAGIAAIFKAPVGGIMFALEVIQMSVSTFSMIILVLACLISSLAAYILSDFTFDIRFNIIPEMDPHLMAWVILFGVICGLYSIYYNFTKERATALFTGIRSHWLAAVVTGSILSVAVFFFPSLFGEGFSVITGMVNGENSHITACGPFAAKSGMMWIVISVGAALLLKGILVSAAFSGGGVSGDFVPTFFAGALLGWLFATGCNHFFGVHLPVWYFALIGMGAVMAGTIHAPLMAFFILCETTNTYVFILPYFLSVMLSYGTVKIITPHSWYSEMESDDIMALMSKGPEQGAIKKTQTDSKPDSDTDSSDSIAHDFAPDSGNYDTSTADFRNGSWQRRPEPKKNWQNSTPS